MEPKIEIFKYSHYGKQTLIIYTLHINTLLKVFWNWKRGLVFVFHHHFHIGLGKIIAKNQSFKFHIAEGRINGFHA